MTADNTRTGPTRWLSTHSGSSGDKIRCDKTTCGLHSDGLYQNIIGMSISDFVLEGCK